MKKLSVLVLLLAMVHTAALAHPGPWHSALVTSSTTVVSGKAILHSIIVVDDAANACTVNTYDNTSAAGDTETPQILTAADGKMDGLIGWDSYINTGIHVTISTAGTCSAWVEYRPRN
jgi:hypothetical protein